MITFLDNYMCVSDHCVAKFCSVVQVQFIFLNFFPPLDIEKSVRKFGH